MAREGVTRGSKSEKRSGDGSGRDRSAGGGSKGAGDKGGGSKGGTTAKR